MKLEWPEGFTVHMGQVFKRKHDGTVWRIYSADFQENEIELASAGDPRFIFRASVQEMLDVFTVVTP